MVVLRADTLRRALVAANDNELVWPLIPLFDGFFGCLVPELKPFLLGR
jgi:hypothetical protein